MSSEPPPNNNNNNNNENFKSNENQAAASGDAASSDPAELFRYSTESGEIEAPWVPEIEQPDRAEFERYLSTPSDLDAFSLSVNLLTYTMNQQLGETSDDAEEIADETVRSVVNEGLSSTHAAAAAAADAEDALSRSNIGVELRNIADDFNQSRYANEVRILVDEIRLDSITYRRFYHLLEKLFHQGYSLASFVTLFSFVSRLLLKILTDKGMDEFKVWTRRLIIWFLTYVARCAIQFLVTYISQMSEQRQALATGFVTGIGASAVIAAAVGLFLYYGKSRN